MFLYEKELARKLEEKAHELLHLLECKTDTLLKELSGVDKITLTRLRELLSRYDTEGGQMSPEFVRFMNETKSDLESLKNTINTALQYVTPKMFGAIGDGSADDTKAVQDAINFAVENDRTLLFPNGLSYRITKPLVLRKGQYTFKGEGVKCYHLIPDMPEHSALFVGDNYPTGWTEIEMHIDGVNARPLNYKDMTHMGVTCFRALIFIQSSRISHCKLNYFGIVFEGTFKVVTTITDCQFFAFREHLMCDRYRLADGTLSANRTGCLNDSKIINCYLSGSRYFMPKMFNVAKFDQDAQINNCFIEFCEYLFTNSGEPAGGNFDIQGCTLRGSIIQYVHRLFDGTASHFRFYECEFVSMSTSRIVNEVKECPEIATRIGNRKSGVYVLEENERKGVGTIVFNENLVDTCDHFIWVESGTASYATKFNGSIKEYGTNFRGTDTLKDGKVHITFPMTAFEGMYFESLNGIFVDAIVKPVVKGNIVGNIFPNQIVNANDGVYMACRKTSTSTPFYGKIHSFNS